MSIFPFIDASGSSDTKDGDNLPMLREYAYDYENNELKLDAAGRTYLVEGNEALRIWIFKALTTARFRYTAYSAAFGEEYEDQLIRQVYGWGCSASGDGAVYYGDFDGKPIYKET